MKEWTLNERDILAIFKVALDEKTALNAGMKHSLLNNAQKLELTEQEEHDAAVHAIETYRYATTLEGDKG
jgi:hypothetical protein